MEIIVGEVGISSPIVSGNTEEVPVSVSVSGINATVTKADFRATGPEVTFTIIKGTFHVKGYQPDGDSIRFKANRKGAWKNFAWHTDYGKAVLKKQLRLEAIDAMEVHYNDHHQPLAMAIAATGKLLNLLGITGVQYGMTKRKIIAARDGAEGYIATNGVDEYDRPVCLLFPTDSKLRDGARMKTKDLPMNECINLVLCREGLVYPTFYTTTDSMVADIFTKATREARNAGRGLWIAEHTRDFTLWNLESVYDDYFIFPKLFRRLVDYFETFADFDGLASFLREKEDVLYLRDGTESRLDRLIEISDRRIRCNAMVEDIFFVPKG